nr:putative ribonuclease H-like domain-containing protein [Tanacetum cinerariifolium]
FDPEPDNREVKSLYERFVKAGNMHEVPPPITRTFMPTFYLSDLAETQATFGSKSNTYSIPTSETNDFVSCDNSDMSSASETYDFTSCVSSPKTNDSFSIVDVKLLPNKSHLIKDCNVHDTVDNFLSIVSKTTSVPAGSRNSSASIHAGRSIPAASRNKPASIHTGKHIPADRINKPAPFPAGSSIPTGWTNPTARLFFGPTNLYFDNQVVLGEITDLTCNGVPRIMVDLINLHGFTLNDPQGRLKEKLDDFVQVKGGTVTFRGGDGKITGKGTIRTSKLDFENVYYVEELQNFNLFSVSQICDKKNKVKGGTVTFRGGDGKITGKGTIRTSKLDFENVYYVEELQNFNLFSVSQICDKKNKVLFTDAECLVLTKEFQLPDESQTINKLAKHGLVEGLLLKLFTNERNCVACNKGKQHKASYKAISAGRLGRRRSISESPPSSDFEDSRRKRRKRATTTTTSTTDLQRAPFTTPHQMVPKTDPTEPLPAPLRNKGSDLEVDNLALEGVAPELAPSDFVSQNYETLATLMQEETKKRLGRRRSISESPPSSDFEDSRRKRRKRDNRGRQSHGKPNGVLLSWCAGHYDNHKHDRSTARSLYHPHQTVPETDPTELPPAPLRNKGSDLEVDNLVLEGVAPELA